MYQNSIFKKLKNDKFISIIIILPSIVGIAAFVYVFISITIYTSFSKWNDIIPNMDFNGFQNYIDVFKTERFILDIRNTIGFTILFLAVCIIGGFILALILDKGLPFSKILQSMYLFPMAISFIVAGVVWRWLLNPTTGVNHIMQSIGFKSFNPLWYTDPSIMCFKPESGLGYIFNKIGLGFLDSDKLGLSVGVISLVIAAAWMFTGYTMAMYLAALRGMPIELREAAIVDGVNDWQYIYHIIIPVLKPITLSAMIILGHISLKIFDLVSAMTGPGPGFSTDVPAYFMFDTTFRGNHFAQGATLSIIILIIVAVLIIPYLVSSMRTEDVI
jgi:glucose/mannose transport system permease protein